MKRIACTHCGRFGPPVLNRREMLQRSGLGLGALALTWLLGEEQRLAAADGQLVAPLQAPGPVKNLILIHHGGGLSHVDSFDPKPELQKLAGKEVPESFVKLMKIPKQARLRLTNVYPSPFEFKRSGQSGLPISSLFPHLAQRVDDLCLIRSMQHTSVVHTPADYLTLTGSLLGTRPSLGAWLYYGLGSENRDLPGFVNMIHGEHFSGPAVWSAGFLPAKYQGVTVNASEGIPDIVLPSGTREVTRRAQLDLLAGLNQQHLDRHGANSELEARIASYEMAFRMQTAAPEAFDIRGESEATRQLYGLSDEKETAEFGRQCLLARRLVERGVRFVQLIQAGWDAHGNLLENHTKQAKIADKPIAALLADLKARGLLGQTLVICGGEFGRTPAAEGGGKTPGRDHSPQAYTVWLAGGTVKGGQVIGATDDIGYTVVERPVHPNDLQATMLHALGIDQRDLYYTHQNRKEMLTVNGGEVVKEVFG
ncbi:MAG: DUF1501 domain-containing protein [Verrucomicrobiales bacterium]|nr:DUF1501 domain-containing protein [Verrucomicrobiales bacterium]